jgi:hypothetical protein
MSALSVFGAALMLVAMPLIAQPVANPPDYKIGDRWEYRQTVGGRFAERAPQRLRREVADVAEGIVTLQRGNGTTYQVDAAGNSRDVRGPDWSRVDFKFPMHVGDQWTFSRHHGGSPSLWLESGTVKVVAFETITVPAGTFDCFRIVREYVSTLKLISEQNDTISWYCPSVKVSAREEWTNRTNDPYTGGSKPSVLTVTELVSYTPGSP